MRSDLSCVWPLAVPTAVSQKGLVMVGSNPADVGDMRALGDTCVEFQDSRLITGLDVAPRYAFDFDGDGALEASEEKDYVVVSHSVAGIIVYDVTNRTQFQLVGRVKLPAGARNVRVDALKRRLYVAGAAAGVYVVDFDSVPSLTPIDSDQDGTDGRGVEV